MEIFRIIDITTDESTINEIAGNIENALVGGSKFLKELIAIEEFPIKNNRMAVQNIMKFLAHIDTLLKRQEGSIVPIAQGVLIEFFSKNKYCEYISLLKKMKVMTAVPYRNGKYYDKSKNKCKLFRFHNDYLVQDLAILFINRKGKMENVILGNFPEKLVDTIMNIEVDVQSAIKAELENKTSNNSLRCRLSVLLKLYSKRWIKKGKNVDRVYHSLSNLSKISREYLHIDGAHFHDIDVKNCQPLLLCYLLLKQELPVDKEYIKSCEEASLYEDFIEPPFTREATKVLLYKSVYFDFKPSHPTTKRFKQLFPLTYSSLQIISKDRITIASKLQNLEAEIFNGIIPKKSKNYFTLFDAVYFTDARDILGLKNMIEEKFMAFGIKPILSVNLK